MKKIEVVRIGNKVLLSTDNISIEFDARFGEKGYPFNCALYNIRLSQDLIAEIESSKIIKVDPNLCVITDSKPDSTFYPLFECGTDLYVVPQFGYSTEKITAVFYSILENITSKNQNNHGNSINS